jgi:hypothetical protein
MLSEKLKKSYKTVFILSLVSIVVETFHLVFILTYNGGIGLSVDQDTLEVLPFFQQVTLNYIPNIGLNLLQIVIFIVIALLSLSFLRGNTINKISELSSKLLIWVFSLFLFNTLLIFSLQPPLLQWLNIGDWGWGLLFLSYPLIFIYSTLGIVSFILLIIGFVKGKKKLNVA